MLCNNDYHANPERIEKRKNTRLTSTVLSLIHDHPKGAT